MELIAIIMPLSFIVLVVSLVWILTSSVENVTSDSVTSTSNHVSVLDSQEGSLDIKSIASSSSRVVGVKYKDRPERPAMITAEELARRNGSPDSEDPNVLWLSMMSEVFDVSSAPHYYGPNRTYNIFAGRDANVPFVTGNFTPAEAARSVSTLTPMQMMNLETFLNDTYRFGSNNYTFLGYLVGELYDVDGNPTQTLKDVHAQIALAKVERDQREKRRQELLAERRRKDEEKRLANGGMDPPKLKPKIVRKDGTVLNDNNPNSQVGADVKEL